MIYGKDARPGWLGRRTKYIKLKLALKSFTFTLIGTAYLEKESTFLRSELYHDMFFSAGQ